MILNLDETGLLMIPVHRRTFAVRGARQVPGIGKKVQAQITKVSMISAAGDILPYQLIFQGKTDTVLPKQVVPAEGSFYDHTPSHFANTETTLRICQRIIIPWIQQKRAQLLEDKWGILIWDNFSAHLNVDVVSLLEQNRIKVFPMPPRCTSKYQPLDVNFNGPEKKLLQD